MSLAILDEYTAANPRSRELYERASRVIPGGITHASRLAMPFPITIESAAGSHKTDVDGHEVIDYVMGHGALLLGHRPPAVTAALEAALAGFQHGGSSHEREVEWAERVCRLVPAAERVHFTSSGTEATMLALQVARAFTGRQRVLRLEGHFHGWHDAAALDAAPSPGIPEVLRQVVTVVPPDAGAIEQALAGGDVAVLIMEATGASYGAAPIGFDVLAAARELTLAAGTVLIFDEVISGFRWSPGGLQQVAGITPDLTTLAKIVSGGQPGGALAGAAEIMEVLAFRDGKFRVRHPGTHNAHPMSAAAGVAMLDTIADGAAQSRADEMAGWLRGKLNGTLAEAGVPGFVHGDSSVFHIVLGRERPASEPGDWWRSIGTAALKAGTPAPLSHSLQAGMLLEGVHLFKCGGFFSAAHSEADVERTVAAFERTLHRLRNDATLALTPV